MRRVTYNKTTNSLQIVLLFRNVAPRHGNANITDKETGSGRTRESETSGIFRRLEVVLVSTEADSEPWGTQPLKVTRNFHSIVDNSTPVNCFCLLLQINERGSPLELKQKRKTHQYLPGEDMGASIGKVEAFLRACAVVILVLTACLVGMDAQTKAIVYTYTKKATFKDLNALT